MNRKPINPVTFSIELGFDQAQLVVGHRRELVCSAQDSVDSTGATLHPGDMSAQLEQAMRNLEAILTEADMTLADVVRLNVFTTDVDELIKNFPALTRRFDGHRFATTVLGVSRLAGPDLVVALEATAMD